MATLPGQRAQFTWALNQYNLAEDTEKQQFYARYMAKYIAAAPAKGFTVEEITKGQLYPVAEVGQYVGTSASDIGPEPSISEGQALTAIQQAVGTSDVLRFGNGSEVVYAYGYPCAPDRVKVGQTTNGDSVARIAAQITTSTPDKPELLLEIRTCNCKALERAIHASLEYRGRRVDGGGKEWFKTTCDEVVAIYRCIAGQP